MNSSLYARLTFISYGVPEVRRKWLDQQGSYMATVAVQPVFRLLETKDLGVPDDSHSAKLPPVNAGLLNGELAWRQDDGGHTDGPNWKYFITWADKFLHHKAAFSPQAAPPATPPPADQPTPRTDPNSLIAHEQLLEKSQEGSHRRLFWLPSLGRRTKANLHRTPRPTRKRRSRPSSYRRSQRHPLSV
jgi:hypothetical protein